MHPNHAAFASHFPDISRLSTTTGSLRKLRYVFLTSCSLQIFDKCITNVQEAFLNISLHDAYASLKKLDVA